MLSGSDLQLLGEIGFSAVSMGNMNPAREIFQGVLAARPGNPAARLGLAMSHYMVDDFDEAEKLLRAMADQPEALTEAGLDPLLAKAHLGLTLVLAGREQEARPFLEEAMHNGGDMTRGMVKDLLEQGA